MRHQLTTTAYDLQAYFGQLKSPNHQKFTMEVVGIGEHRLAKAGKCVKACDGSVVFARSGSHVLALAGSRVLAWTGSNVVAEPGANILRLS